MLEPETPRKRSERVKDALSDASPKSRFVLAGNKEPPPITEEILARISLLEDDLEQVKEALRLIITSLH